MNVRKDEYEKKDEKKIGNSTVAQKIPEISTMANLLSTCLLTSPIPLKEPRIDDDFNNLSTIERVYESFKYIILCFEYSISPNGSLRQWIKINISLFILFGIPILIFVPLATYSMKGFENISELLANTTQFLLVSALNILKLIGVLVSISTILYILFKFLIRR